MIGIHLLTPPIRRRLKSPLGLLIQGSFDETIERLRKLIEKERPSMLISVGDVVSNNMLERGIQPQVLIVDNKVMRKKTAPIQVKAGKTLHLKNPAGTLTERAWTIVQEAVKEKKLTRVLVDGEEDLLTLVVVLCAPKNSLVVYGQPHKGIVAVKVTEQKKEQIRQVVDAMEQSTKG